MKPVVGMRVRLNVPDDTMYDGAKSGDIGTIAEIVLASWDASGFRCYVRWDNPASPYFNYSPKDLQYDRRTNPND